jgi:isopentenyl diphosphate isomerase/L-lactate dehydrogenase-like FMN-dependent dehydrogenase
MDGVAGTGAQLDQARLERLRDQIQVLHEVVKTARTRLDRNIWDYMRGATETETTAKRNRLAIDRLAFRPRVLRDVHTAAPSATVMGHKLRLPVILAPIGSLESFDAEGGVTAMRAASAFGCGLMLSSVSTIPLEDVAARGGDGFRIAMYYKRADFDAMAAYAQRAVDSGYLGFCLTVDSAFYSRRERDIANRFVKPWRTGQDSHWQAALNWDDVKGYKDRFDLPLILKGIATAEDAAIAVEHGVDVVYVSNHGGRQLDHGRGSMDVLPEVVKAVDGKAKVWVDGSIQRGGDLIKAMALGAEAVGMGRMLCCALATGGAEGVVRMLELVEEEARLALGMLGVTRFDQLEPAHLHAGEPVTPPHVFSAFPLMPDDDYTY